MYAMPLNLKCRRFYVLNDFLCPMNNFLNQSRRIRVQATVLIAFLIIVALLHRRGQLYRFDDFLTAWSEKLRAKEPTSMTVRLQKDVDKYKVKSVSIYTMLHLITSVTGLSSDTCLFRMICDGKRTLSEDFPTMSEDFLLLCEDFPILSKGYLIPSRWIFPKINNYSQTMLKTSKTIRDCLDHILNALCLNVKPLILFANSFGKMQAKKQNEVRPVKFCLICYVQLTSVFNGCTRQGLL